MIHIVKEGNPTRLYRKNKHRSSLLDGCMDCYTATDLERHFVFPTEVALTMKRPDIVICSVKLRISFRYWVHGPFWRKFQLWQTHQWKLEKYEDLQEQHVRNGWMTNIFLIQVRCRGFITNSTSVFLTNLGLSRSDWNNYLRNIQDKVLVALVWIWRSHRGMSIRKHLVVLWVTVALVIVWYSHTHTHTHTYIYIYIYIYI